MRDVTYPERLRLYDHPAALAELERAVPWFTTLLTLVRAVFLSETVTGNVHERYLTSVVLTNQMSACRSKIDTNLPVRAPSYLRIRRPSRRPLKRRYKMPTSRCLHLDQTVQSYTPRAVSE